MTSKEAIKRLKRHGNDQEDVMELYDAIEDEIFDLRHNYNVVKERFENSANYGAKIQAELNELKRDVARYFELFWENLDVNETNEFYELEEKLKKIGKEE